MLRAFCHLRDETPYTSQRPRRGPGLVRRVFLLALLTGVAQAAPALRTQVVQRGNFLLIGNTLAQDCGPGMPSPLVGILGPCGTNTGDSAPDVFWRADAPAAGQAQANASITVAQARSSAVLQIPPGAQITQAYLYWAGNLASGTDTAVTLDRPGAFSVAVSAVQSYRAAPNSYTAVADVTALVEQAGSGIYRVSDVDTISLVNLNNSTAATGWWLVVLYRLDSEPLRQLSLHDGLDLITDGAPATVSVAGFQVPAAGYSGSVGVVALDGDSVSGDQLLFNGTALSNALNPADNFFNSTRSHLGAAVSRAGDLPQLSGTAASLSGLDLDVADVSALLSPGQTSAGLTAQTSTDTAWLASLVTAIPTTAADFGTSSLRVTDLDGGAVRPGDVLEYSATVTNSGDEDAQALRFTNALPAELEYVPGSLEVTGGATVGAMTDAQGDDQAEFVLSSNSLVFRLGQGANAVQGGQLAAGAQTTLRFRARVKHSSDCSVHLSIANQGNIYADGAVSGLPVSALTDGDAATAGTQATQTAVDMDCLTLALPPAPAHGLVTSSLVFFACSAGQCTTSVPTGSSVTLTATADAGYRFGSWGDDCAAAGTAPSATVTVDGPTICSATFAGLPDLSLSVSDGRDYARYGELLNYGVTLSNSGTGDAGPITVTGALPPQLDAAQMSWTCVGAGNGASCVASGMGPLSDNTVFLPAGASLSWQVTAPVLMNAQGGSVEYTVTADAQSAGDSTALALFQDGFESIMDGVGVDRAGSVVGSSRDGNGDGKPLLVACEASAGDSVAELFDAGTPLFTLPVLPRTRSVVETVLRASAADGSGFRVERLNLQRAPRVRLVTVSARGEERAGAWADAEPGTRLAVGVARSGSHPAVLLEGARQPLAMDLPGEAAMRIRDAGCKP
ncbi:InlB B-repeat-containing protein [Tahibacter harae]|uniref:Repeat protein (TIGR01451 family) n=1 Tax=Tahibacter harae TaxID=2963937 RepID=A0ABT1QNN6_9GAMM|nr:hypothetical protein [Tahibacter harae]MCQ4163095.1 hypothetical protein [Tahibacter harae]